MNNRRLLLALRDKVERKDPQWFIENHRTLTVLADLDKLDHWPDTVKTMQRFNEFDRSEGVESPSTLTTGFTLTVYTTRPVFMGCTPT